MCKRCSSIRLFEVPLNYCIEDEREKIKNNTSQSSIFVNNNQWQPPNFYTTTYPSTIMSSVVNTISWSGGYNNSSTSFIVPTNPLSCLECPNGECELCFLEPGGIAGFMEKCETCENKFLCATNRLEVQKWGII